MLNNQNQAAFAQCILVSKCIQYTLMYIRFEILHPLTCGPFCLHFSSHFPLCLVSKYSGSFGFIYLKKVVPLDFNQWPDGWIE